MEFGFFGDLSETDQAYVKEILTHAGNVAKLACKGAKKPEFSWMKEVAGTRKLLSRCSERKDEQPKFEEVPVNSVSAEPVSVTGMPNAGFTAPIGVPIGFAPYIGTYAVPPGMFPVAAPRGMVFMHAPQMYVPGAPIPTQGMTPLTGENIDAVVNSNTAPYADSSSVNNAIAEHANLTQNELIIQKTPDEKGTIDTNQMMSSNTTKERRNKKRRPSDYYEKLAAEDKGKSSGSDSSMKDNIEQDERTSEVNVTSEHNCSVPSQNVAQTLGANSNATTVSHINESNYALSKDNQTCHQSASLERIVCVTSSNQNLPQTTCDNNTPVSSSNNSSSNIKTADFCIDAQPIAQSSIVNSSVPVSQGEEVLVNSQPRLANKETNVVTTEPVKEPSVETSPPLDTVHVQEDTKSANEEVPVLNKENTSQEITNQCNTQSLNKTEPVKVQSKPSSWAGLFSETQEAKNATVVYVADSSKESEINTDKQDEEIPIVVSPKEDQLVCDIGEILVNHRLNHRVVSLTPRGLKNRRNWCYVSATLQALLACPPFYHLMKALPHIPERKKGPSSTPVMDCLCDFVNQFSYLPARAIADSQKALNGKGTMRMDIPQGPTFEPTYVYDVLKTSKYASAFLYGRQEDAEEFLSCFLNGLHDEMVACMKSVKQDNQTDVTCNGVTKATDSEADADNTEDKEGDDGWEQVGPKNKAVVTRATDSPSSPISNLFQGQIRSILHQTGVRESATLQPFFTLQLDIQSDKVWNVKDALDGLVKKESLQDFTCSKTKQEVEATRRITLEELPPVLILHLKYFLYDKNGGCQKLPKQVDFGIDLEISKDLLSPNVKSKLSQNQRKYKLFGVVNHHGARALGGHYTSYVFHVGINGWVHIDDEIIRTVGVAQVLKHNPPKVPYLLYYRKVEAQ